MLALIGHDDWIRGAEWANFGQYETLLEVGMAGTSLFFFLCYIVLSQSEKRLEKLLDLHLEIRREHWGQEQGFLSGPKITLTEARQQVLLPTAPSSLWPRAVDWVVKNGIN